MQHSVSLQPGPCWLHVTGARPPLARPAPLGYPRPIARQSAQRGNILAKDTASAGKIIRFRLDGHSCPYDPLKQAIRPDLADIAEAENHFAPHYAEAAATVTLRETALLASNHEDAEILAVLPAGAAFALLDVTGDWAWGYAVNGHRVGYLADADLSAPDSRTV